ncbi:Vancomycin B-type resistance protein VanW [Clostridium luticellarii]|uniref:Vancomycin B-type resistance protein VanW n=2 Tax=Clostridium luticellarii TaxID=1691940 RepID=A0A2T0BSE4_9CLOT|nr:Vancomycin B-type resistance protein VanW [Clostridium luticellarii]
MNQKKRLKKRKKTLKGKLVILAIGVLAIFSSVSCGFIVYHYNDIKYWDNLIYPKVSVNGTDLSGKTKSEARDIIKREYSDKIQQKKINILAGDKKYELSYANISPSYNVDEVINQVYSYGKNENIFKKYQLLNNPKAVNYELKFFYDEKPIKNLVSEIENETNSDPVNASLKMGNIGFEVIPQQDGVKLKKEELEKELVSKIDGSIGQNPTVKANLETIPASIKEDELKTVDTLISSFSTNYGSISSSQRANNITLATKSINGYVLMPGSTFSFNGVVGQRTAAKGYQAAPVIVGDKVESGLGGGICQVSTTLYNAVYKAGLTSTERVHHTLPVHYVAEGMDATVDYGNIDYKFRNDFKYPVYIEGYTSGGNVAFNLYSNSAVAR